MTITGKKFSQLTAEQKIATRLPIAGWLVNNLFINSNTMEREVIINSTGSDYYLIDAESGGEVMGETTESHVGNQGFRGEK